jgi:4-hydroxy-tetrahydrodipicolinate synthase
MQGIIAAIPTPVDATGAPLRDLFLAHCDWLLTNGCDGLNVLGSTGEANSFDTDTRETNELGC